mgnify:CR=1 FL=1
MARGPPFTVHRLLFTQFTLRLAGALTPVAGSVLTADDTHSLLLSMLTTAQQQELQRAKSVDLCFSREGIGRFRANAYKQRGNYAIALRVIPYRIRSLSELGAPAAARKRIPVDRQRLPNHLPLPMFL